MMINNVITNEDTYLNATYMPIHIRPFIYANMYTKPIRTYTYITEGREANALVSISGATRILKILEIIKTNFIV